MRRLASDAWMHARATDAVAQVAALRLLMMLPYYPLSHLFTRPADRRRPARDVEADGCGSGGFEVKGVQTGRVGEALFRILISERAQCSRGFVGLWRRAELPSLSGVMLARSLHFTCVSGSLARSLVVAPAAAAATCTDADRLIRTRCASPDVSASMARPLCYGVSHIRQLLFAVKIV